MNGPFQVAQANISGQGGVKPPARIVKIAKPFSEQSVTVALSYDGSVKADLSAIAGEKITLVHIGEKLIILFDNKSTVTLEPFFDSTGKPLDSISVEVSPGRDLTGAEFAATFPVTEDQSVLPASGDGNGNAQASGANFSSVGVDPLALPGPLDLLGQEELPNFVISNLLTPISTFDLIPTQVAGAHVGGITEEEQLGRITEGEIELALIQFIGTNGNEDPNDATAPKGDGTNADGNDTDTAGNPNAVTQVFDGTGANSLSNLFTGGDLPLTFTVRTDANGREVVDSTGHVVTAGGQTLHYGPVDSSVAGQTTVVAGIGSGQGFTPVFEVTIFANGDYHFVLIHSIDHPDHTVDVGSTSNGSLEETLFLDLTTLVHVKDATGTESDLTGTNVFNIGVIDDTPVVQVARTEGEGSSFAIDALDESIGGDRGAGNNGNGASDDVGSPANHTPDPTGTNAIGEVKSGDGVLSSMFEVYGSTGADGFGSVTYAMTLNLIGVGQNNGAATTLSVTDPTHAYGNDSTIYLFAENGQVVGRVGSAQGAIALRISLDNPSDPSNAHLIVDQYLPINHGLDGNAFDTAAVLKLVGAATLGISLEATLTDGDGDVATSSQTAIIVSNDGSAITFEDDGPAPLSIALSNSAVNGLFFDGFVSNSPQWGQGSGINSTGQAGGWAITASPYEGASSIQLERVGDGYRGSDSPTDSVMVDLEASPGNVQLSQNITGLEAGTTYHLTFEIGAASDAVAGSAKLEVLWNGAPVGIYIPNSGVMQTISIDVTALGGSNSLTFRELGEAGDNTGTFLANVKLIDAIVIDETKGVDADSDDTTSLAVAALFAGISGQVGSDPDMGSPQYAQGKHSVVALGTADYGTDGPAATNPLVISISSSSQGVYSGLKTTEGKEIYLFTEGNLVVGRFDADNDINHTAEMAAFALNVDPTSGILSIALYVSLQHPDTTSSDEGVYLNPGSVTASVKLTDGDGDYVTSSTDISAAVRFEDDGPSINPNQNSSLRDWTIDEDVLPAVGNDSYDTPADTNDYTQLSNKPLGVTWGADGAKALTFSATDSTHPTITITDKNGAPVAGGLSSGGVALTYEITTNPDGGQTLIAYKGNVHSAANQVFTLTLDPDADASGAFSFQLLGALDHPKADGQNTLNLNFGFKATDGDGDTATSSLMIRITDDVPYSTNTVISRTVDEDDINTPWSHGTSPSDGNADGSLTEASTGAAIVSGTLAGLVAPGADLPGAFGFTNQAVAQLTALGLFSKETAQGNGENGKPLTYSITNGAPGSNQIIITGTEPNPQGNPVFSLTLNTVTGAYEFRLYDELIHMPGNGENNDLRSGQPVGGLQSSVPYLDLGSIITYTDKDGDPVTLTGKFTITITDDVPRADVDLKGGSITIDETGGNYADNTGSNSVKALFAALEGTFVNGQRLVGDDPDVSGDNNSSTSGNGAIAYAHSNFAIVTDNSVIGSDSPPYPHTYALSIAGDAFSGLYVTDGSRIMLSVRDGLVIGTVESGPFAGKVAFAIAIESDGEVSVAQYLSIKHDDRGDPNESNDNGSNGNDASPDDTPNPIQQTLDGKIVVTLTVTDSDGDKATDTVNIGKLITFLDDGPSISIDQAGDSRHPVNLVMLALDETRGGSNGGYDDVAASPSFLTAPDATKAIGSVRTPISSQGTSVSELFDINVDGGADGVQSVVTTYKLTLKDNGNTLPNGSSTGVKTNLVVTELDGSLVDNTSDAQRTIFLFMAADGSIVGKIGIGSSLTDYVALHITIDPATGDITVAQYLPIEHGNTSSYDETALLKLIDNGDSLGVTATSIVTDGDGDTATATKTITLVDKNDTVISIDDDGPSLVQNAHIDVNVYEDGIGNADNNHPGEVTPSGSAQFNGAIGALNALVNFGTDGPNTDQAFSLKVASATDSGLNSMGKDILIASDGNILRGYVNEVGNSSYQNGDRVIFTLTVNADGSFTFKLLDQVDHAALDGQSGDNTENSISLDLSKYIAATDGDDDTLTLPTGVFVVKIQDDVPYVTDGVSSITVDEDDIRTPSSTGTSPNDGDTLDHSFTGSAADNQPGPANASGTLAGLVSVGADAPLTYGFAANSVLQTYMQGQGLKSQGGTLSFEVQGNTLYGFIDNVGTGGHYTSNSADRLVFTLELTPSNGNYKFSLYDQLDHAPGNGQNNLPINFGGALVATDYDGDSISLTTHVVVNITDDVPVLKDGPAVSITVDEDDIQTVSSTGTSPDDGDGVDHSFTGDENVNQGGPANATGSLAGLVAVSGADESLTYGFGPNAAAFMAAQGIKSHGTALSYQVVNQTLYAFVNNGGNAAAYDSNDRLVFTLDVNQSNGQFKFSLHDQLDHAPGQGQNNLAIDFGGALVAIDYDKDPVTLTGHVIVNVTDDVPVAASGIQLKGLVDEDDLSAGAGDNSTGIPAEGNQGSDSTTDKYVFTASQLSTLIANVGADDAGTVTLVSSFANGTAVLDTDGHAVKSQGGAVLFGVSGNTIVGYVDVDGTPGYQAGDRVVFKLTQGPNGDITFDLQDQIDHPNASGDNAVLNLNLSAALQITDYDGDSVPVGSASFVVAVENDIPATTNAVVTVGVAEDYLSAPTDGATGVPPGTAYSSDKVQITTADLLTLVVPGADEGIKFSLNQDITGVAVTIEGWPLTSHGGMVILDYVNGQIVGFVNNGVNNASFDAGDRIVFTLTPNANGFEFNLQDKLDHNGLGSTGSGDAAKLTLDLASTIIATDFDGDTANLGVDSIRVIVENDIPTLALNSSAAPLTVDETNFALDASVAAASLFTVNYGADGPAAANSLGNFVLHVKSAGVDSGLVTTITNQHVFLFEEGGAIVGRAGDTSALAQSGTIVFKLSLDGSSNLVLDQSVAVRHPDHPTNHDEPTGLSASDLITLTGTATDYDLDSTTATVNIGDKLVFKDDGPFIQLVSGTMPTLTTDDTFVTGDPVTSSSDSKSFASMFSVQFGQDGPKDTDHNGIADPDAVTYALGLNGGTDVHSGVYDTLTQQEVLLNVVSGVIVGTVNGGSTTVFTISVDSSGNVKLIQDRSVVHDNPNDPDEALGPTILNITDGHIVTLTATVTDGDSDTSHADLNITGAFQFKDDGPSIAPSNACIPTPLDYTGIKAGHVDERGLNGPSDHDVLLSGGGSANNHNAINTTGTDIGVGNQWIDANETLRLDFVNSVAFSGNGNNATFDYDGHYSVKSASFTIAQVKGQSDPTTVFVQVFDANDNKNYNDDGSPLAITAADVTVSGDATYTKTLVYDNGTVIGVVISGLNEGATVTVDTAADFDRLVVKNYAGVAFQDTAAGNHTTSFNGQDFSIGGVSSVICTGATLSVTHDETAGFGAQGPNAQDDVNPALAPSELTTAIAQAGISAVLGYAESGGTAADLFGAVSYGADGPAASGALTYKFTTNLGGAFTGQDSGLNTTVGNKDIFLFTDPSNPNIVWGVDSNNFQTGQKVFALHLDGDGHIWIAQFAAIAHDISGSSAADFDDEVSITNGLLFVTATAKDGDGDTAYAVSPSGIHINFQDDGPAVTGVVHDQLGPNLIVNGDFESYTPVLSNNQWGLYTQIPGWKAGGDGTPFELQNGNITGVPPHGGTLVELDGDRQGNLPNGAVAGNGQTTHATIEQTVITQAGTTYELEFYYSPRPDDGDGNNSGMQVLWNGNVVYTLDGSTPGWQKITLELTGTGSDTIAFRGFGDGEQNQLGALLDDVSLRAVSGITDDEDTQLAGQGIQGGLGDDGSGTISTGHINFDAGADGLKQIEITGVTGVVGQNGPLTLQAIYVDPATGKGTAETLTASAWVADGNGGGSMSWSSTHILNALVLTINADGSYALKQNAPLNHPAQDDLSTAGVTESAYEDNLQISFGFKIVDGDGDWAPGTITVAIDDDLPVAANDGKLATVAEHSTGVDLGAASIVLNNDKFGADGHAASGDLVIATGDKGGTITINGSGNLIYSNTSYNVANGATATETFTYTIKDGDGDTSTATFSVELTDTGVTNLATSANLVADEDDLASGNHDSALGDDVPVTSGHISYTVGSDGFGAVALSTAGGATGLFKLDGTPILTSWDASTHTLTGYGTSASDIVFTIVVSNEGATGADYTMTLNQPVMHSVSGTEDNTTPFTVNVTVTDGDGSVGNTSFTVAIDDDLPVAHNDGPYGVVEDGAGAANTPTTSNVSGNVLGNDVPGADGLTGAVTWSAANAAEVVELGTYGTLQLNANGTWSFVLNNSLATTQALTAGQVKTYTLDYTITDNDGDTSPATLTLTITGTNDTPTLTVPEAGGQGTLVDEAGLPARGGEPAGSDANSSSEITTGSFSYTNGDGATTVTINGQALAVGANYAGAHGTLHIDSISGTTVNYTYTLTDNVDNDTQTPTDSFAILVADSDGNPADDASANLVITIVDDNPQAHNDGPYGVVEDGAGAANTPTTSNVSGNVLGNDVPGADGLTGAVTWSAANAAEVAELGTYGTLQLNANGTWSFVLNNSLATTQALTAGQVKTYTLDYTITDNDGDTSPATLTLTITGTNDTPTLTVPEAGGQGTLVDEAGLPARGGEPAGSDANSSSEITTGSFSYTNGDGATTVTINGQALAVGANYAGAHGTLHIDSISGTTVNYTYTLTDNVDNDTQTPTDSFAILVADSDGNPADDASANLVITIVDDNPQAHNDGPYGVVEDGAGAANTPPTSNISGNVLGNDVPGADGLTGAVTWSAANAAEVAELGTYGTLQLNANGTWSFVLNNSLATTQALTAGQVKTYTLDYTITDNDGDTSPATLTLTITGTNDTPTLTVPEAGGQGTLVDEAGLPARGGEPAGSDANSSSEITTGSFSYTNGDGATTVTINGQALAVGANYAGAHGTLHIDSISGTTVNYTYTLTDNVDNDTQTPTDSFAILVADSDGNPADDASANLVITIVDDNPQAHNDTDSVGTANSTDGNVITGADTTSLSAGADVLGADGASVSHIQSNNVGGVGVDVGGSTPINGQYGTLTIDANGHYVYTRTSSSGGTDTFTYTLKDGDGDLSTATLQITLDDTGRLVVGSSDDDDGIAPDPTHVVDVTPTTTGPVNGSDGDDILFGDPGAASTVTPGDTANVVFVLDTSGSMDANISFNSGTITRIEAMQAAVNAAIDQLAGSGAANVRIHIVEFNQAGGPGITFDLISNGQVNSAQVTAAHAVVNGIDDTFNGPSTNYESALQQVQSWVNGSSVTYSANGAESFDSNGGTANGTAVLLTSYDTKIAVVSAWNGSTQTNVTGTTGAMGVSGNGSDIDSGEFLRFDFGTENNYGIGSFDPSPATGSSGLGSGTQFATFNGPPVEFATFSFTGITGSESLAYTVYYTDNTNSSGTITPAISSQALGTDGKTIAYIEFTGVSGDGMTAQLTSITVDYDGPLTGAGVKNKVVFISDGEPTSGGAFTDEVSSIETNFGQIEAVGINVSAGALSTLNTVEGAGGSATNIANAQDLAAVIGALSGGAVVASNAGSDIINGGAGTDVIFGDAPFTDTLATIAGLVMPAGSGWAVFQQLEAHASSVPLYQNWTRADTIAYIQSHKPELAKESGHTGGHDNITGGAGDDIIFGQEGNDKINYAQGDGQDTVDGGTGSDTLYITGATGTVTIAAATGGTDIVPATGANATDIIVTMSDGGTIRMDSVEDIDITAGPGGVNIQYIGSLANTALDTSTVTVHGGAGDDILDLTARSNSDPHKVIADGGEQANADIVKLDFSVSEITAIEAISGGVKITHAGGAGTVTDEFTNFESFEFEGGVTKDLAGVLAIDLVPPTLTSISMNDTALKIGETAIVTVVFSEKVDNLEIADFNAPGGTLSGLSSADGGQTWTMTFAPTANSTSSGNQITLTNSSYTDIFGNVGSGGASAATYSIDTKAPTVTINGDVDPVTGQQVVFDVVFSESVTGFTGADISFTGSTAPGSLSASVSGSGTTYQVTVTGMTGSGSVVASIIAGAAFDTAGNASAASTSTDNSVAFTLNNQPIAGTDTIYVSDSTTVVIPWSALLANDSDVDLDTLSITAASGVSGVSGTPAVTIDSVNKTLTFTTPNGADTTGNSFTYTVSDGNGGTATGTVNVVIQDANNNGVDTVTFPTSYSFAYYNTGNNNDAINIAPGQLTGPAVIDGGAGTGDSITLTSAGSLDLTKAIIANVETLNGSSGLDNVTISAQQWAAFSTINLQGNSNDVLNVKVEGTVDISGITATAVSNAEFRNIIGGTGDDTLTVSALQLAALIGGTAKIDLGGGNDTVVLSNATTADLSGVTITSVENLTGSTGNDNITLTGAQLAAFTTVDLGVGTADTLNISSGDFTSVTDAQIAGVENINFSGATLNLSNQIEGFSISGSSGANAITGGSGNDIINGNGGADVISGGAGNDSIIYYNVASSTLDGGADTDTLVINGATVPTVNLSVSAGSDQTSGDLTVVKNFENVDASGATVAVNITGSGGANVIEASAYGGTINAGAGADTLKINATQTAKTWTVDLGAGDNAADTIVFNHTGINAGDQTVVTVSNFATANDKIAVTLGGVTVSSGFSTASGSTDINTANSVIEITNSTVTDLTNDAVGGTVRAAIANAIDFIANGTYTVVVYATGGGAGIYTMTVSGMTTDTAADNFTTSSTFTVEHIMTLNGVTANALDSINFSTIADPIVLDLDHNGFAFTSQTDGVQFDINHDGAKDQIAWTKGQDGLLALDINGNGKIDSGSELFTPNFAGGNFADGLAALASLDSNQDGVIDHQDQAFAQLSVWQDANHNGVTDEGELSSLTSLGITGIDLNATPGTGAIDGQSIAANGTFTYADGSKGSFVEVDLDASLGEVTDSDHSHTMTGTNGVADTFALTASVLGHADTILNFNNAEGDKIDLSALLDQVFAPNSNVDKFVHIAQSGPDVTIQVDTTGQGNFGGGSHDVAVLANFGGSSHGDIINATFAGTEHQLHLATG